jgi:hypothetical protein
VRNEEILRRLKKECKILQANKKRNTKRIGHFLHKKCLLKHVIEGKTEGRIEVTGRRGRRRKMTLRKRDHAGSHSVENSLWKRLWTCRKTDCRLNG